MFTKLVKYVEFTLDLFNPRKTILIVRGTDLSAAKLTFGIRCAELG